MQLNIYCCKAGQFVGYPLFRLPENHLHEWLGKFQVASAVDYRFSFSKSAI